MGEPESLLIYPENRLQCPRHGVQAFLGGAAYSCCVQCLFEVVNLYSYADKAPSAPYPDAQVSQRDAGEA